MKDGGEEGPFACFFSYRRREKDDYLAPMIKKFSTHLGHAILRFSGYPLFVDTSGIPAGADSVQRISRCLCRSVCLIAFWTEDYCTKSPHDFCMREFFGMEDLERKRQARLGNDIQRKGLIIPVLKCHRDYFPSDKVKRQYVDFSGQFLLANTQRYSAAIEKLALDVAVRCDAFRGYSTRSSSDECDSYTLPESVDIQQRIEELTPNHRRPFDFWGR